MRATSVDLIGGFYRSESLPWSAQDTVNWLPVAAEVAGTLTLKRLATPPGLRPYVQLGAGPIRGLHNCEGLRLVVSGKWLYRIANDGTGVPIGQIPGVGRVQITHNQFKTGYQVLVENGQGGGGYVYDTTTQAFGRITDPGYPGSISSDFLDSYMLGVEPQGRYWFHSNLADATDYNTLDRYQAESAPDRIVGLAVSQSEVVVFGQRTTEFFMNMGRATGTFQSRKSTIDRGCAGRHTIQKLDNTLFWLGDDGIVYRMQGYAPMPVSTNAIAEAIAGYNWSEAIAFVWEDRGHKVYYLTFPDGLTFGYDVVTRLWHRRESFELQRWRPTHSVKWGRDWYVGDFQAGRVWRLDWDYHLEGDQPIISERTSPVLYDDQSKIGIPNAEFVFDTGQGPGTVAVPFPVQPLPPDVSGNAPDAALNAIYTPFQYAVTGGTAPYVFTVSAGALPTGMTLTSAGLFGGTPTGIGAFNFTVRVTDSKGLWDEVTDSVLVAALTLVAGGITGSTGTRSQTTVDGDTWSNLTPTALSGSFGVAMGLAAGRFGMSNNGQTWRYTDTAGLSWITAATSVRCVAGDILGGKVVIAYGPNSGVGRWGVSTDNGATFTMSDTAHGFDLTYIAISRATPTRVIAGGQFRLAISNDGAATFPGNQQLPSGYLANCIVADGGTFYLGGSVSQRPGVWTTTDGLTFSTGVTLDPTLLNVRIVKIVIARVNGVKTILCFTGDTNTSTYMTRDNFASFVKLPFVMSGTFRDATHNGVEFIVVSSTTIYTAVDPAQGFTVSASAITSPQVIASSPHG